MERHDTPRALNPFMPIVEANKRFPRNRVILESFFLSAKSLFSFGSTLLVNALYIQWARFKKDLGYGAVDSLSLIAFK